MSDITTVPFDYIVKHTKTENIVSQDEHGDYVCDIETEYIPLVRCKDCKYEPICNHSVQHTTHDAHSVTIGSKTVEWCSYGERKESE